MGRKKDYEHDCKVVRSYNLLQIETGGDTFMKTFFRGDDGVYYDPVGDEFFIVKEIGGTDAKPIYAIDFGDEQTTGILIDHGFNEFLGGL